MSSHRVESSMPGKDSGSSESNASRLESNNSPHTRRLVDFVELPEMERIHGVIHVHVRGEPVAGSLVRYPGEKRAMDRAVLRLPDGTQYPLNAQDLRKLGY